MKYRMFLLIPLAVLAYLFSAGPLAHAQEAAALKLWGYAYLDENGNGVRDLEEQPVPGVVIEAKLPGQAPLFADTNEEGWYEIAILPGDWEVTLLPPDGYALPDDQPLMIELLSTAQEGPQVDFALILSEENDQAQDGEDDQAGSGTGQDQAPDGEQAQDADDLSGSEGSDEDPENELPPAALLPESGAGLPPVVIGGILALAGLGLGAGLLRLGRFLQEGR